MVLIGCNCVLFGINGALWDEQTVHNSIVWLTNTTSTRDYSFRVYHACLYPAG